jgi:hypothetical protein
MGKYELGSKVDFEFSQTEIKNINRLMHCLKLRLASNSKAKAQDANGNVLYIDCDIYTVEQLAGFLVLSLKNFNQIPSFTFFSFEDTRLIEFLTEVLVEGATLYALASQALIERGREFQISNNGISFNPPNISELLQTQYTDLLEHHDAKVKFIKEYITYWQDAEPPKDHDS